MVERTLSHLRTFCGPDTIKYPLPLELVEGGLYQSAPDIIECQFCPFSAHEALYISWKPGYALTAHIVESERSFCAFFRHHNRKDIKKHDTVKTRMGTFYQTNWAGSQSPEELAGAGLYYSNLNQNTVTCFSCSTRCIFWSSFQKPWLTHAEQTVRRCRYMEQKKGPLYQERVYKNRLLIRAYIILQHSGNHKIEDYKEKEIEDHKEKDANLQADTIESAMLTKLVKQAVQFGFWRFQIYTVVRRTLVATGIPPMDFDTFFTDLLRERNRNVIIDATRILRELGEEEDGRQEENMPWASAEEAPDYNQAAEEEDVAQEEKMTSVEEAPDYNKAAEETSGDVLHPVDDKFTFPTDGNNILSAMNNDIKLGMSCKICFIQRARIACMPCGHIVYCTDCNLREEDASRHLPDVPACPVCRSSCLSKLTVIFAIQNVKKPEGLEAETERLRNICLVCRKQQSKICSIECRHLVMCDDCSFKCDECPLCKVRIQQTIKMYY